MTQFVFIHGPGAGGCADSFVHQLEHFPGSVAPNLPGHLSGDPCPDVARYTEWLRGWLWAQGMNRDLVLCGFTLGACIALQYALDYPEGGQSTGADDRRHALQGARSRLVGVPPQRRPRPWRYTGSGRTPWPTR